MTSERPPLNGLYFDGCDDKSYFSEKDENNILHRRIQKVEHVSVIQEPGSFYLGQVSVEESKTSKNIIDKMNESLVNDEVDLSNLQAVGCDGMNTNTGKHNDKIIRIEYAKDIALEYLFAAF